MDCENKWLIKQTIPEFLRSWREEHIVKRRRKITSPFLPKYYKDGIEANADFTAINK